MRWRGSEEIIAFIFNTNGGGFECISRLDDSIHFYSYLILDRTKEGDLVTEESVQSYIKEIEKNKLKPFVVFGNKDEEKAIIFTKVGNQIYTNIDSEGYVSIDISDNLDLWAGGCFFSGTGIKTIKNLLQITIYMIYL